MNLPPEPRILVLGIGNILNTDEGVGVEAINRLRAVYGEEPDGFELLDGGTLGLNLLPLVDDASHLLVIDAVDAGAPPGTIVELENEAIPMFNGSKLSEHQLTFSEVLGLAMLRKTLPQDLVLLGVQPDDLKLHIGLSAVVDAAMPQLLERVAARLERWGALPRNHAS
jgi:hydrogenase maturation protease